MPLLRSESFLDTIGVNTHLWDIYQDEARRYELLCSRLHDLGVRYLRDSAVGNYGGYRERLLALAGDGMRFDLLIDPRPPAEGVERGIAFVRSIADCVDTIEGPNEYDQSDDPRWEKTVVDFQNRLFKASRQAFGRKIGVIAPSFVEASAYDSLDFSACADASNLHAYFSDNPPGTPGFGAAGMTGYGSIPWGIGQAQRQVPGKPIYVTETGYPTDTRKGIGSWAVPEEVAGRYIPRLLLLFFRSGVRRVYLYELLDPPEPLPAETAALFGLLNNDADMTPKPAYRALRNLISLLSARTASSVKINERLIHVDGDLANVQFLTLYRRDGRQFWIGWVEVPSWDSETGSALAEPSRNLLITAPDGLKQIVFHRFGDSGDVVSLPIAVHDDRLPIQISDRISVLEIVA